MMSGLRKETLAALLVGGVSAVLLLGALAFQYGGGLAPCEMCVWQRWPHLVSAIIGLGGGLLVLARIIPARAGPLLAVLAIMAIAVAGALGVFHAGVEWKWWEGPSACTLSFAHGNGMDFSPIPATRCDEAQWRLFGLSLAGYNALISFAAAIVALLILWRGKEKRA